MYNISTRTNCFMKVTIKLMAIAGSICAMNVFSNFGFSSFSEGRARVLESNADHLNIQGFTYAGGSQAKRKTVSSYGYFYSDTDYYYSQFTDVSRLYLIRVRTNFTPGSVASKNNESGFDNHYDLWSGDIHIQPFSRTENNFKKSSSYHYIKSWPFSNSDSLSCTVTSSFSTNYSFSNGVEVGAQLPGGASIIAKTGKELTFGFSTSTSIYGPEPSISNQDSPSNPNMAQWNYQFSKPLTSSYAMDCYYLMEVKNDAIAYEHYSFGYQVDIKMTNTAWEIFAWKQHKDTTATHSFVCGL